MYLPRIYDPRAHRYRVRYAIATILRDRVVNEGAFNSCFEMEDQDEVICAILRRGLKNSKLRVALERSHLVNLVEWLAPRPEFYEAYYAAERPVRTENSPRTRKKKRPRQLISTHTLKKLRVATPTGGRVDRLESGAQ